MELSIALKWKGKDPTVDSFAYKWNAPNQGWWKLLLPYVDALSVMGYSETGSKSTSWRSYDFLKAAAGKYSSKLLIGVPSYASNWKKTSVQEYLDWIAKDPSVGLAIGDAQLKDSIWRTKKVWQTISRVRQGAYFNIVGSSAIFIEENQKVKLKN